MAENELDRVPACAEIRDTIIALSAAGKSAHVGSSLSVVEILDFLFCSMPDHFSEVLLSKGHAAMALYATSIVHGKLDRDVIAQYLADGSELWGHPSMSEKHPFIHWSTGSLGHALPVAVGKAYARMHLSSSRNCNGKIATVLSDGELNEGSNWEAFLFGGHHRLSNLVVFIDYNKWQSFGRCEEVMNLHPVVDKVQSFGWETLEIDGHSTYEIDRAIRSTEKVNRPVCIVAHTVKGKGFKRFEDKLESHYRSISSDLLDEYLAGSRLRKG